MIALVPLTVFDRACDVGEAIFDVNPDKVVWVADHPDRPGCSLVKLEGDALIVNGDRDRITRLLTGWREV